MRGDWWTPSCGRSWLFRSHAHKRDDITDRERPAAADNPLSQNSPLRIRVADVEVLGRALVSAVIKLSRPLKENGRVQEKVRPTPSRHTLVKEIWTEEFGDVCQTAQFHVCLRREVEALCHESSATRVRPLDATGET